jgi:hypothetical protein
MPPGEVSSEGSSVADACARGRDDAVSTLRQANVAGLDGAGRRIAGRAVCPWAFRCDQAVVHTTAPPRGAIVIRIMIDRYRPKVGELTAMWVSKVAPMRTRPASPLLRAICLRDGRAWRFVLGAYQAVFKYGVHAVEQRQPPDNIRD